MFTKSIKHSIIKLNTKLVFNMTVNCNGKNKLYSNIVKLLTESAIWVQYAKDFYQHGNKHYVSCPYASQLLKCITKKKQQSPIQYSKSLISSTILQVYYHHENEHWAPCTWWELTLKLKTQKTTISSTILQVYYPHENGHRAPCTWSEPTLGIDLF